MSWCPFLACFPRYKAYTQINTMMWDMRGNYGAEPMSSHRPFPAPPNQRGPLQMRQPAPTYPAPFIPLGIPPAPPSRPPAPNTHPSYHTFPRSVIVSQTQATSLPQATQLQATPQVTGNVSSRHHSRYPQHHPHSLSAATARRVHYADERSPTRSRQVSPHNAPVARQSSQRLRRRTHSAGSTAAPVFVDSGRTKSYQQVRGNNGHEYSRCTGRKKALCIGINYTSQKRELRGCVNDAKNVRRFLTRQWGFKDGDIVMLVDQTTNPRQMPTRKNMIDAMKWLVKDARPHDSLFFHYSGHGGQIPDVSGDEPNGFDEVIYPVDYKTAGVIVDDDLHRIMVKSLPRGCRLTALFDSCHSGTTLDLPYMYHHDGRLKDIGITERIRLKKMSPADVISFAACRDDQMSADTIQRGGVAVGAMSYAFLTALTQKPVQSYMELLVSIRAIVQPHFKQKAQLSSGHYIDIRRRFIL